MPLPLPSLTLPASKPSSPSEKPPSFRRLRLVKTVPVPVIDATWRTHLDYFQSIGDGRHGFDAVAFQAIDYDTKELIPKIYTLDGAELLPFGPISITPIADHTKSCIRLVLLSMYDHHNQRILQALAWQGSDALHLLSEPRAEHRVRERMRQELSAATTNYIHHFFNVDRATDWFLDCEMDV